MAEINVKGFSGANNIKIDERFFVKGGIAEPRVILNADVDVTGKLIIREGKTAYITLAGAHSLWAGKLCMLMAASGTLYRNVDGTKISLSTISGPNYPLSYAEVDDKVYISNPYWQGIFDPSNNAVTSWGVSQPPGPMLLAGEGGLPAGTYNVCMTNVSGSELSGNGPISSITLASAGGIQVLNRPSGAIVWVTDSDEYVFYRVGAVSKIIDIPTIEPLPSFLCGPPPFLENLCYAFGRIWGSNGSNVYYSQPFNLGLFKKASNIYPFEDDITLIAKVPTGLFIGMQNRTRFLEGTIPEQMKVVDAGAGSVKGTLSYCNNMPELGWTLGTPEKDFVDVPVWVTTEGIVVGGSTGKFFNLTKNKLKGAIPAKGASLYRNREGMIQFLTNFRSGISGSGLGFRDADTDGVFERGRIDIHSKTLKDSGGRAMFSDDATCSVIRGGVEI